MRIVLTGGGTGGHLIPLVAVAKKISEKVPAAEFIFIGPDGKLEREIMQREGIPTHKVFTGKMRRYFSFQNFIDAIRVPLGIIQALWLLLKIMPDAIFSKGGYASIPVVVVGWLYRIPIMIHESDSVPGVSNSILGKFADRIAVSYPEAEREFPKAQVVLTGNPLRADIEKGDADVARRHFSLLPSKKTIFVMGGSQGARSINERIIKILPELLRSYQVIHQTGEKNIDEMRHKAGEFGIKADRDGYHPIGFIGDELKDILAVSDLVVSRAGANSISEIAANKKPAILIPLENSASDHQKMNAYSIARTGGCIVLEENNLGEHMLLQKIQSILEDEEVRQTLARNISQFYHPNATERIAEGILGMIN